MHHLGTKDNVGLASNESNVLLTKLKIMRLGSLFFPSIQDILSFHAGNLTPQLFICMLKFLVPALFHLELRHQVNHLLAKQRLVPLCVIFVLVQHSELLFVRVHYCRLSGQLLCVVSKFSA